MEYAIQELAKLAGISSRTLRHYDRLGLLRPKYVKANGYRYYGAAEVDRLQQILFYRERGLTLAVIKQLLDQPDFDVDRALTEHLTALRRDRVRLEALIATLEQTIQNRKVGKTMSDSEKFKAFKEKMVADNEAKYGAEIREKYGAETVDASNRKLLGMTEADYQHFKALEVRLMEQLQMAVAGGAAPDSPLGREIAGLHKEWLLMTWPKGHYNSQAHRNLADMYLADERFKAYYEAAGAGATEFLREAIYAM